MQFLAKALRIQVLIAVVSDHEDGPLPYFTLHLSSVSCVFTQLPVSLEALIAASRA